jgi:glycosyltransferase involved in cell wall biosynthesis
MARIPRIVFVTPVFGTGATGPETYARYLWDEFGQDKQFEFHLVAPSLPKQQARWHAAGTGAGSLDLYGRLAQAALNLAKELAATGAWPILHVNNSNLHASLLDYPGQLWGQVNDYENADLWRRAGETIRRAGIRRFMALARRRWLERRFLGRQNLSLCNSNFTRQKVLAEYRPPHPERLLTLYKAVDVRYFERPPALPADPLRRPATVRKFVFVGSDIVRKGLDTLLSAVRQLPENFAWHLTVVGVTAAEVAGAFGQPALTNEAKITFTGPLEKQRLREVLWCSDVFVLPSRAEALGVAVLEALAAGLPVVASNVGGLPEIICDDQAGVLLTPDDPAALAGALQKVQPWSQGLPAGVRKILDSFSTQVMLNRLRTLYLQSA